MMATSPARASTDALRGGLLVRRRARASQPPDRRVYTARLLKGGALANEMRTLVAAWDGTDDCVERLVCENVLSHRSRARSRDVIRLVYMPRFVSSQPPDLWRPLAVLEHASWPARLMLPIHFYAAASADALMTDFVEEVVAKRYALGMTDIDTDDVVRFLERAPAERFPAGRWGDTVNIKVARGLLAALRDFGLLGGAVKKRITPLYLPLESFAFLAFTRHAAGVPASEAVSDPVWRLFQLGDDMVEHLLVQAQQWGLLGYHAAGSIRRIDFPAPTLVEYAHALAQRPH